jgi:hypothetical protein
MSAIRHRIAARAATYRMGASVSGRRAVLNSSLSMCSRARHGRHHRRSAKPLQDADVPTKKRPCRSRARTFPQPAHKN